MKNAILIAAATLSFAAQTWAAACAAVTYDNYKAGGFACTVGPLTFSNFTSTYTNAHDLSNTPIADANVDVTIINAGGFFGLQFSLGSGMAVRDNGSGAQTGQAQFTFDVSGAPLLVARIGVSGTRDGTGTNATFTADVSGTSLSTDVANGILSDQQPLPGLPNSVSVSHNTRVTIPGGNTQQAQIQSIQNSFSAAPEPGTLACFAAGLLALASLRRNCRETR
jgi:hypothetical protein